jgi:hypothetical protein
MEVWFNASDFSGTKCIFAKDKYGYSFDWSLFLSSSTLISCYTAGATAHIDITVPEMSANIWNHVALVSKLGIVALYLNGIKRGEQAFSLSNSNSENISIGCVSWNNPNNRFKGYLSNIRIVQGVSVYTENFIPSTSQLTAISGTALLICQSNRFKDNSGNNLAMTTTGVPKIVNNSPFAAPYDMAVNGGSIYVDGTDDYLSLPSLNYGDVSGIYTIECWVYLQDLTAGLFNIGANQFYMTLMSGIMYVGNGHVNVIAFNNSNNELKPNVWTHIAVTSDNGSIRLFYNGILQATSGTMAIDAGDVGYLGARLSQGVYTKGYIADFRFIAGQAIYTANFTVPQAPLTAVAGTKLLLNGINAGVFDSTGKNVIETVGNAKVSTAVKRNGSSSIAFDGGTSQLVLPSSDNLQFGSGDFTIEAWVYPITQSGTQTIYGGQGDGGSIAGSSICCYISAGVVTSDLYVGSGYFSAISPNPVANVWSHVAYVRSGSTWKTYLNGTQVGSVAVTGAVNIGVATYTPKIGVINYNSNLFNGYIDDFIITKGVAKYVANFTVPTVYDIEMLFNGTEGSTTFTNSGQMILPAFTIVGSASSITTTSPITGTGSLLLANNNYIYTTMPRSYNAGTTPVTFEFSFKKNGGMAGYCCPVALISSSPEVGRTLYPWVQVGGLLYCGDSHTNILNLAPTITDGVVYHGATTFDGTTWRVYLNGTLLGYSTTGMSGVYDILQIGAYPGGSAYTPGLIDNVRITFGVAKYTGSSYTVSNV